MANSGMVAFLPDRAPWVKQDFPHLTVVYVGNTDDRPRSDFNAMAKDAITAARTTGSFGLQVLGVEEFDEGVDAVDVLRFHPTPQLMVARKLLEGWDTSDFKDYKPHVTIGPSGSAFEMRMNDPYANSDEVPYGYRRPGLPLSVYFSKIAICWNDDKLIFNINSLD